MKIKTKIWIEEDNAVVFGEGRYLILKTALELGSLKASAEKLGLSYRAAWGKIKATEKFLGIKLVESSRGRKGGISLTTEAHKLLDLYEQLKNDIKNYADQKFREQFLEKIWQER
ncbi:molybdate transport repressor ModE domain protein [Carboxydothermus islandicus]|uniref:Molybdate transport repressor ModE domain protein n=1 Tax=Carboxydothermus islandicus TaxID=661089 RepID=A0A1L8D5B6_9THEO|nr:LysR family transcriptional regulator [Carboxydothermus islandicus]GAV26406.1 molybdate transport repressor ModE domain protein [Carboxydothermus islandicus]